MATHPAAWAPPVRGLWDAVAASTASPLNKATLALVVATLLPTESRLSYLALHHTAYQSKEVVTLGGMVKQVGPGLRRPGTCVRGVARARDYAGVPSSPASRAGAYGCAVPAALLAILHLSAPVPCAHHRTPSPLFSNPPPQILFSMLAHPTSPSPLAGLKICCLRKQSS